MLRGFESLNPAQREAVSYSNGPLLILAGAGSGKTRVIVERILRLIKEGCHPHSVLAITFTNKAAQEMRERVEKELRKDRNINLPTEMGERPFISTFHSLGVHILREQSETVGVKKLFSILDREDSRRIIKNALEKIGLDPKTHEPGRMLSIISKEKGRGISLSLYNSKDEKNYFSNTVSQIWYEYEKILKEEGSLDFDDLLLKTRDLLRDHPTIREHYQKRWEHLLIDEYQDTNRVQYEISRMLVGPRGNVCAVGDIDQNIYSWRGAEIKNILDFEKDYPNARIITLEENYRSTKTILDTANIVIEKNTLRKKKNLITKNVLGEKIGLFAGFDETSEAEFVAEKAGELIRNGLLPEEIAVLYRANFQSRILEESFMHRNLPYQIIGTRFFERKEVKDILSYLKAGLNPESLGDIKRIINIPARGIGKTTVAKVFSGQEESLPSGTKDRLEKFRKLLEEIRKISETKSVSETIVFIIKSTGLEDEWKERGLEEDLARLENAYELVNFASRYDRLSSGEGVLNFLTDCALQSDQDELREDKKGVRLLTIHAAKGLEFDTVFITGLEDGLFPHNKINKEGVTPEEAEEERRLFYVALTRAKKKLFLTYAQTRTIFGRREVNIPSEFLLDIPEEFIDGESIEEERFSPRRPLLDIEF